MPLATRISQKCRYAFKAVFELALRNNPEPVKTHQLAKAQAIPARFLEIILSELKAAGFLLSRRGNEGGYMLARPPRDITLGEIIRFIDGGNKSDRAGTGKKLPIHKRPGDYALSRVWQNIDEAVTEIYDNTTFADLLEEEQRHRAQYVPSYAI